MLFAPSNFRLSRKGSIMMFAAGLGIVMIGVTLMEDKYRKLVKSEVEKAVKKEEAADVYNDASEESNVYTSVDDIVEEVSNNVETKVSKSRSDALITVGLTAMCLSYVSQTRWADEAMTAAKMCRRRFEHVIEECDMIRRKHNILKDLIVDIAVKGGGAV